jgi:hypothetical protein
MMEQDNGKMEYWNNGRKMVKTKARKHALVANQGAIRR